MFSAHFGYERNCSVSYDPVKDMLSVTLLNCPKLDGDVRVLFQTSNKLVPKAYEKCPFYFWFNTALEGTEGNNSKSLTFLRSYQMKGLPI